MLSRLDNVHVDVLGSIRMIVFDLISTHRYFISNVAKDGCSQGLTKNWSTEGPCWQPPARRFSWESFTGGSMRESEYP